MPNNRLFVSALSLVALLAVSALPALAQTAPKADAKPAKAGPMDEITILVTRVKALDRIDVGGTKPDFFARATIGGQTVKSEVSKQQDSIKPNWKLTASVPRGKTAVKLELLDKDVLNPSDTIDINRVDKKRNLEFDVDTAKCRISGFSEGYGCGSTIKRAGKENKKAEIDFKVSVKKGK